jgi:DNA-binding NtrC family response regulator
VARILIADDKKGMREVLSQALVGRGHNVQVVSDGDAAVRAIDADVDLVITDLRMPGKDGLEVLKAAMGRGAPPSVIVMTAFGSVDAAVEAMRLGASDFVTKPFGLAEMEAKVAKALGAKSLQLENQRLREVDRSRAGRLVGEGAAMRAVRQAIAKVSPTPLPVLVTGESGTGKELVAREVHESSPRREGPFVPVNCAALAEGVLESELFGHEKGSFTGAAATRRGKFELASGGTLFLDEIGEIAPSVQVKLLRFLQEKEIERVGGEERIKVDARVVAATNRDLEAEIKAGRFREDLFYRLNVVRIAVPPLRDRLEDLPALVDAILTRVAAEIGRQVSISAEARQRLPSWRWPGNIRELENVLARAAVLCEGGAIGAEDLRLQPAGGSSPAATFVDVPDLGLEARVDAFERALVVAALEAEHGNQSRAAERLKIKRSTLQYKMGKHGLLAKQGEVAKQPEGETGG